jgi:hypothetical protein
MAAIQIIPRQLLCALVLLCPRLSSTALAQPPNTYPILQAALSQLHVKEASARNDGPEVKKYLAYVGLKEGQEWCAAFVCWSYAQAGYPQPRNAWSPALFPKAKIIEAAQARPADIFGIWVADKKRIGHVGLLYQRENKYWLCIEGNSNDAVQLKRRPVRTLYKIASWTTQ